MAEVTVRELAETVDTPPDRLLKQMQEAGLPHRKLDEAVSEDQKQTLLAFLRRSHGGSAEQPKKITIRRKKVSTLKAGQGRGSVNVEFRKKRTYVKRAELGREAAEEAAPAASAPASAASAPASAAAPPPAAEPPAPEVTAAEPVTAEAAAPEATAAETAAAETAAAETAPAEPAAASPRPARRRPRGQLEIEAERIHAEESARQAAQQQTRRQAAEAEAERKRREQEAREAAERARLEAEAAAKAAAEELARERDGGAAEVRRRRPGEPARAGQRRLQRDRRGRGVSADDLRRGGRRGRGSRALPPDVRTQAFERPTEVIRREVALPESIQVGELAQRMSVKAGEVIKTLMGMGVMATINQSLDQDTATLVVEEMGHIAKPVADDAVEQELVESLAFEGEAKPRPPVVTVMGHVDHGKTSLLDYIRKTRVAAGEAGGITQHIGAYHVDTDHGTITFLDTPGHAAFTAMRARGARFTDVVILVVAADDGVMPQTEEAINHARAAGTPLVVAVNKIDKEGADPERVKNELAAKDVIPDEWGGDTQFINVSAVTGEGIDALLEAISLQAELLELQAVPDAPARGVVVESRLDRGRGPVATLLVQNGTLKKTDVVVAGEHFGRVRAMLDENGRQISEAGPSIPVEVLGLSGTPDAGDEFSVAADDRTAREVAAFRSQRSREQRQARQQAAKLDNVFANIGAGEKAVLNIVLKADVRGSLEAITQSVAELGNEEVEVNVVSSGVGGITESDANLAVTANAVVIGFNVRADAQAKKIIEREGLELRYYSVIYEILDDLKQVLSGMLAPELREEIIGVAEVREVFRSPRFGQVAGCMALEGTIHRNKRIRVLRDDVVIFEGELESLRRFKDDVSEVRAGLECGIAVRGYNDVRVGDKIEVYDQREVARAL